MACALLLWAIRTHHSHTFLPLLTSPFFLLILSSLPSAFSPCPVTEPSVWTDCDIGCVGDRLAGVISEGEKNRSASLYLTPSLLHQPLMKEQLTRDTVEGNVIHLFFKRWLSFSSKGLFEFKVSGKFHESRKQMQKEIILILNVWKLWLSLALSQTYVSLLHIITHSVYQTFSHTNCEPMTVMYDDPLSAFLCM